MTDRGQSSEVRGQEVRTLNSDLCSLTSVNKKETFRRGREGFFLLFRSPIFGAGRRGEFRSQYRGDQVDRADIHSHAPDVKNGLAFLRRLLRRLLGRLLSFLHGH